LNFLNQTLEKIPPSGIRKFFEIVAEQPNVISLSVGEPDFDPPWIACEAAIYACETSDTHYSGNRGTPALRTTIAQYFKRKFQIKYSAEKEILVTNGASEAFDLSIRTLLNPDDEVLISEPAYVMYAPLIKLAYGKPVIFSTNKNGKILPKNLAKKISPKTRALILNYPANPTGATFVLSELEKIAEIVAKNNLFVISDEIYAELSYEKQHIAFASLPKMKNRTATISGVSKSLAMTGFRIGWLAAPEKFIDAANKIHQYSALCANSVSQAAATAALNFGSEEIEKMRAEYQLRRDFVWRALRKIGFIVEKPAGAFYIFPEIYSKTGLTGDEFALKLLKKEKVAVVPGSAFGAQCKNFVRISYAASFAELTEALMRIERFVEKL
jgi:aminotransferase